MKMKEKTNTWIMREKSRAADFGPERMRQTARVCREGSRFVQGKSDGKYQWPMERYQQIYR